MGKVMILLTLLRSPLLKANIGLLEVLGPWGQLPGLERQLLEHSPFSRFPYWA